jgi:hypothetical protein
MSTGQLNFSFNNLRLICLHSRRLLIEKIENDDFDINLIDGHSGETPVADSTEGEGEDTQRERQITVTPFEYLTNAFSTVFTEPLISSQPDDEILNNNNDNNNNNVDELGELPSLSTARPTTFTRSFSVNSEGKISLSEIRERLSEALAARALRRSEQSLLSDEDRGYSIQGSGDVDNGITESEER